MSAARYRTASSTALVVCPDDAIRASLACGLQGLWRVDTARGTAQGLDCARTLLPRLVVAYSDLALVRAIRADIRIGHVPVLLVLPAGAAPEAEVSGLEGGADAVLTWPLMPERVRAWAHRLVDTRQALRERWSRRAVLPLAWEAGDSEDTLFLDRVRLAAEAGMPYPAFSIADLAHALHASPRQLTRRLKALTGESPGAMIRRLRIGRAAHLLTEGHTVAEVAEAVGFRSRSHFGKAFQCAYGVTPSEYAPAGPP